VSPAAIGVARVVAAPTASGRTRTVVPVGWSSASGTLVVTREPPTPVIATVAPATGACGKAAALTRPVSRMVAEGTATCGAR